ncbi:hypothetical protein F4804DRAFT_177983 [Jackrogersella minutella]|nr:hypothetical protein F4804DRAFT_177983 [Jackrogersella minutella]
MTYTVVCSERPLSQRDIILSFREPGGMLDEGMVKLAKEVHSDLAPKSTYHGNMERADPPLSIYAMPYLRGSSYIQVMTFEVELDSDTR